MTYVLSDIHGNLQRFESIMTQINLQTNDTLYVLGDVIDRYAGGIKILRQIMRMPNAKMLIGNHEYMMLNAIGHCKDAVEEKENTNRREKRLWYRNGGMITHEQLKHYRKDIRAEIFDFIRQLPTNLEVEVNGVKYKLVHASPEENYMLLIYQKALSQADFSKNPMISFSVLRAKVETTASPVFSRVCGGFSVFSNVPICSVKCRTMP